MFVESFRLIVEKVFCVALPVMVKVLPETAVVIPVPPATVRVSLFKSILAVVDVSSAIVKVDADETVAKLKLPEPSVCNT